MKKKKCREGEIVNALSNIDCDLLCGYPIITIKYIIETDWMIIVWYAFKL